MKAVRIIALGNEFAGDDGAAMYAVRQLVTGQELIQAGRPGLQLLELLNTRQKVLLLDVVQSGKAPGYLHRIPLRWLPDVVSQFTPLSSHGFGLAEVLLMQRELNQPLPDGYFIGIEGKAFTPGSPFSKGLRQAIPAFLKAIRQELRRLAG